MVNIIVNGVARAQTMQEAAEKAARDAARVATPKTKPDLTAVQFHGMLDDSPTIKAALHAIIDAISDDSQRRLIRGKLRSDPIFSYDDPDMQAMNDSLIAIDSTFNLGALWDEALLIGL